MVKLFARMCYGVLNALRITTIQEEAFVGGKSFSYEDYHIFAADEEKIFIFDTSAFTGKNLTFLPLFFAGSAGPILIDIYTDVVESEDGTPLQASNRREGSPPPQSKLSLNPVSSTLTTRFAGDLIPATGLDLKTAGGSSNERGLPFEIDPSKKHAIKMTNKDGEGVYGLMKLTWLEL